jgi:hypothetical protein
VADRCNTPARLTAAGPGELARSRPAVPPDAPAAGRATERVPAQHPGASAGNYFGGAASGIGWVIPDGPAWLAAHAALGLALVVAALAAVVWQRGSGSRLIMFTSVLGALAILGAAFNGVSFLNYGQSFSSMIMAGLWALALACYVVGLFAAARAAQSPGRVMPSARAGHGQ